MTTLPLTVERLLEALSAKTDFSQGILGDLAEEFTLRAERDGTRAARQWYYREAMRVSPHLLRDWARSLRARDVRHSANVVLASYVIVAVLAFFSTLTVISVMQGLDVSSNVLPGPMRTALSMTSVVAIAVVGGVIAAWMSNKTPLVHAIALGILWTCVSNAASAIFLPAVPTWYRICSAIATVACTTIGGVLYVRATRFSRRDDAGSRQSDGTLA